MLIQTVPNIATPPARPQGCWLTAIPLPGALDFLGAPALRGTPTPGSWPSAQGLAQEYDCRTTLPCDLVLPIVKPDCFMLHDRRMRNLEANYLVIDKAYYASPCLVAILIGTL